LSTLYQQVCTWENFNLAWRKAARGKSPWRAITMVNEFTI
jgi:hypothetical protein